MSSQGWIRKTRLRRSVHAYSFWQGAVADIWFSSANLEANHVTVCWTGHWNHYRDDMFFAVEGNQAFGASEGECGHNHASEAEPTLGIKPMNWYWEAALLFLMRIRNPALVTAWFSRVSLGAIEISHSDWPSSPLFIGVSFVSVMCLTLFFRNESTGSLSGANSRQY